MNNFAIRYTKRQERGKRERERAIYRERRRDERENKRERESRRETMAKMGEEGRRMESEGVAWLSECDLGREFTMQYQ